MAERGRRTARVLLMAGLATAGCAGAVVTSTSSPKGTASPVPAPTTPAATEPPTARPVPLSSPTPTSGSLVVTGAINGHLEATASTCDQEESVGGHDHLFQYVAASGRLGTDLVTVWVFDPAGPGEYETAMHVIVHEFPVGGAQLAVSVWGTAGSAGVRDFDLHAGAELSLTLPPEERTQGRGTAQSDQPLTILGRIACRQAKPQTSRNVTLYTPGCGLAAEPGARRRPKRFGVAHQGDVETTVGLNDQSSGDSRVNRPGILDAPGTSTRESHDTAGPP